MTSQSSSLVESAIVIDSEPSGVVSCGARAERPPSSRQQQVFSAAAPPSHVGSVSRRATAPWSAAQVPLLPVQPSASSSSADCSRLPGRRPRQTWKEAREEEGGLILTAEEGRAWGRGRTNTLQEGQDRGWHGRQIKRTA